MIQGWKAFYERGLPAGVRAAGVEQMKPSDQELRQARKDLAENAGRIARKGPTQQRMDLQRQIETKIAEKTTKSPMEQLITKCTQVGRPDDERFH